MLRTLLSEGHFCTVPGVFDGVSAKIADAQGFPALYLTGYGVSASLLGRPDAGYLTMDHMVDRIRRITAVTSTPLIADADTGFGGIANVEACVLGYEHAGAQAIQIEDQEFPKRCGHTKNKSVIDADEAALKIKVACDSRSSADFLVIARTDALSVLGLDEALRRGERFLEAGADILFIESPQTETEFEAIARRFEGRWLLANLVEGGRSPLLPASRLRSLGYQIALYPVFGLSVMIESLTEAYAALDQEGDVTRVEAARANFDVVNEVVGFPGVWALDEQYGR